MSRTKRAVVRLQRGVEGIDTQISNCSDSGALNKLLAKRNMADAAMRALRQVGGEDASNGAPDRRFGIGRVMAWEIGRYESEQEYGLVDGATTAIYLTERGRLVTDTIITTYYMDVTRNGYPPTDHETRNLGVMEFIDRTSPEAQQVALDGLRRLAEGRTA